MTKKEKKEKSFQPMLAASEAPDLDAIAYPCFGSPKLDGIRCFIHPELGPVSRNLKPIRNDFIRTRLAANQKFISGMDGELVTNNGFGDVEDFNTIQSKVMSQLGMPDFTFKVFDYFEPFNRLPYVQRFANLKAVFALGNVGTRVEIVSHTRLQDRAALEAAEAKVVGLGYEGLMIRSADGPYKFGRSTLKEGYLLKIKRFEDAEAEVVDVLEEMENTNEAFTDEVGRSKRSKHKAGLVPTGRLGKFVCRWERGPDFEVGSMLGVTKEQRRKWWELGDGPMLGRRIKFKFQGIEKDRPRFPVFLGFREDNE